MSEVRRHDREAEEIVRIREIVGRHALPEFITGFDVELGEADGERALWVIFATEPPPERDRKRREAQTQAMNDLVQVVRDDLLSTLNGPYPFFRFSVAIAPGQQRA